MNYDRQKTGKRIRLLRKSKGLSQENLAKLTGFQRETISNIERGKPSETDTIIAIADALECSTDYLLRGIMPKSNELSEFKKLAQKIINTSSSDRSNGDIDDDIDKVIELSKEIKSIDKITFKILLGMLKDIVNELKLGGKKITDLDHIKNILFLPFHDDRKRALLKELTLAREDLNTNQETDG